MYSQQKIKKYVFKLKDGKRDRNMEHILTGIIKLVLVEGRTYIYIREKEKAQNHSLNTILSLCR